MGTVEPDHVASFDIDRTSAEANWSGVEVVEIHQVKQRVAQRGGVVKAGRTGAATRHHRCGRKARFENPELLWT